MFPTRSFDNTRSRPSRFPPGFEGTPPSPEPPVLDAEEMQKQIDAAVAAATEGLRTNNASLKSEKTELKSQFDALKSSFDSLGGVDGVKALMEQQSKLRETELGNLLADGKHDEWFDTRTAALRADYESKYGALENTLKEKDEAVATFASRFENLKLDVAVSEAAVEAKTLAEVGVLADIKRAAREVYAFDPELDALVMKDAQGNVVYGKDGKTPKPVSEWLLEQQEKSRHWWGVSTSGKAPGSKLPGGMDANPWSKEGWSLTKQGEVVREHGLDRAKSLAQAAGSSIGATHAPSP